MLEACRVVLRPESGIDKPPVRLPADCLQIEDLPKPYDFALGTCEVAVIKTIAVADACIAAREILNMS